MNQNDFYKLSSIVNKKIKKMFKSGTFNDSGTFWESGTLSLSVLLLILQRTQHPLMKKFQCDFLLFVR